MTGIASRFLIRPTWSKFAALHRVCKNPVQSSIRQEFYSTNKEKDKQDEYLENDPLRRFKKDPDGIVFKFGKWKFYLNDFIFKNLEPDKVHPSYKMCYRSGLETYANFAILTAACTALVVPTSIAYGLAYYGDFISITLEMLAAVFGSALSSVALYFISLKVPLRIYYSATNDNFLVVLPRVIPYATRMICILPGHVEPPKGSSQYAPWINLQHIHTQTKQKMLIDDGKFILPMYYNKLMGY